MMSSLISFSRSKEIWVPNSAREIPVGQGLGDGSGSGKCKGANCKGLNDDVRLKAGNVSRDKRESVLDGKCRRHTKHVPLKG